MVIERGADAGAIIDPNGEHMVLVDENGQVVQEDMLTALLALVVLKDGGGPVVLPDAKQAGTVLACLFCLQFTIDYAIIITL